MKKGLWLLLIVFAVGNFCYAQEEIIEVEETLEEFIKEHHITKIENLIHRLSSSKYFLKTLLEKGHDIDPESINIQRKHVDVGADIDVHVKHFTEHQNFTMIMVPISFYDFAIYDTLLFSVIEVSDQWLENKFPYDDLSKSEIKDELLSLENHASLSEHMYEQALSRTNSKMGEVKISLHETYISTNSIHLHSGALTKEEKHEFKKNWSLMKRLFSHNVELNIEMNIYIFGYDDMEVVVENSKGKELYTVTPNNIFTRHHFLEE